MSKGPSKSDYKPTETDKMNASVAMAEYEFFKENYEPLLLRMRDEANDEGRMDVIRGRANADTMQALTGKGADFNQTQQLSAASDMSQAYQGQLGVANRNATEVSNNMGTNVLGMARKQVSTAQTGMAQASRLATSAALERAKDNQLVSQAKMNAAISMGTAGVMKGYSNYKTHGSILGNPNQSFGKNVMENFDDFMGVGKSATELRKHAQDVISGFGNG